MKISARNLLKGTVKAVTHGAVNSEVILELPGGIELVSIITKTSAENLGLAKGKEVYAVIKASNVILATD
jgi:molybdopterin-binding protein